MGGRWMEDLAQCFVGRQAKPAVGPNSQQDTNTHTHTHTDMGYEFYHDSLNHSSPDHAAISRGHVYLERQQRQVHKETLAGTYSNYSNGPAFTTDVCFFNSNSGASGAEWWMSICLCTIQDVNDTQALFTPLLASRALLIYCMSFMLENSVCFLLCAIKKAATSKAPHGHVLYCTHVLVLFHPSPLSSSFLEVDKLLFCWTNFCLSTMETETPGHVKYVEHMDPLEFNTHNLLERSLPAWKVDHTLEKCGTPSDGLSDTYMSHGSTPMCAEAPRTVLWDKGRQAKSLVFMNKFQSMILRTLKLQSDVLFH